MKIFLFGLLSLVLIAQSVFPPPAGTGGGGLLPANNLSDIVNPTQARSNIGLGSIATHSASEYATTTGTQTDGDCVSINSIGQHVASGAPCGSGGSVAGVFTVVKTNATTLAAGTNCSSTNPCNLRFGSTVIQVAASFTITISGGTGLMRLYAIAGVLNAGAPAAMTATCSSGCTPVASISAFPNDSIPLWTWLATASTVWDASGGNNLTTGLAINPVTCGSGLTCSNSGSGPNIYFSGMGSFIAQTDGATVTWNVDNAPWANAVLTFTVHSGSRTLNMQNLIAGGNYQLKLIQDGTGGEGLILGTGCTWKVSGGGAGAVTLSTGASAIDLLSFAYDGTNCLAAALKNFN